MAGGLACLPRASMTDRNPHFVQRAACCSCRRRVAAAFRADADRADVGRDADARPPIRPPLRDEERLSGTPRPEPLLLPPPLSLFTVAHARRSASRSGTPRFS